MRRMERKCVIFVIFDVGSRALMQNSNIAFPATYKIQDYEDGWRNQNINERRCEFIRFTIGAHLLSVH